MWLTEKQNFAHCCFSLFVSTFVLAIISLGLTCKVLSSCAFELTIHHDVSSYSGILFAPNSPRFMDNYGHVCRLKTSDERAADDEDVWLKTAKNGALVSVVLQFVGLVSLFVACLDQRMLCQAYLTLNYFLAAFSLGLVFLRFGTEECPSCTRHPAEGAYTTAAAVPLLVVCTFSILQMPSNSEHMVVQAVPQHEDEEMDTGLHNEVCKDQQQEAISSSNAEGSNQKCVRPLD